MLSIHYANLNPVPAHANGLHRIRHITERALQIAALYAHRLEEPVEIDRFDSAERLTTDIIFQGDLQGSEPLSYTWMQDPDHDGQWTMHGSVKIHHARSPVRTHVLIGYVIHAWSQHGLVTESADEYGYLPNLRTEHLRQVHGMDETPTWLTEYVLKAQAVRVPLAMTMPGLASVLPH